MKTSSRSTGKTYKCTDCGKRMKKGIIFDWPKKYPWCKKCWKSYLRDHRQGQKKK